MRTRAPPSDRTRATRGARRGSPDRDARNGVYGRRIDGITRADRGRLQGASGVRAPQCAHLRRVLTALEMRRRPLVLTERRDHLELMASRFAPFVKKVIVLRGGMPTRERDAALTALRSEDPGERLVLATGRYLGEGFDYAPLDTLFLTLPISWKGTLAQYVGRLHREHASKRDVLVVDYSDLGVPMLARMAAKRVAGYRNLGYVVEHIGVGDHRERAPARTVIPTLD